MNSKFLVTSASILSLILIAGWWLYQSGDDRESMSGRNDMNMSSSSTSDSDERRPLYWVAPMDANYQREEPGLSPMGMPLIPVYESGDTITVASSIQQNLGVRTALVTREDFSPIINAVGYAGWDESSIRMLHTRAEGWLEAFNLASVGDSVKAGDVLYELFAPNLVSVQREYLTTRDSGNSTLTAIARDRLFALGFTLDQVEELDRNSQVSNRLIVRAERDATVTHIGVRQGNFVEPRTPLATLASLDNIWVETEVFESKSVWIEPELPVSVSFSAFPGEMWATTIAYVYPNLDSTTRSLRMRLIVDNDDHRLRPNMFASVQISAKPKLDVLTVPREAVIRAGAGERVIVALGEGRFRPQVVRTGIVSSGRIEILSGLSEEDIVVTSGQFLLDSEANGEQAFARLSEADADSRSPTMPMRDSDNQSATVAAISINADTAEITYSTIGVIRQIATGASITIAHEPVADLGWPAMTMAFQIPAQMNIGNLAVDDAVQFEFLATPQGSYQLVLISNQEQPQ
ncbi:MAG: efflux RND transporter periplasmic adaptor subunit [Gammaproteobacteria bacterium]|nr:efflux RND transporter periplasmic adaptor subunit [Gammaproteobacteria bacterium]MBL4729764.1 efflux RND transporter periplasmic adaptor subunit [Gammaproteobacteria bacterium]